MGHTTNIYGIISIPVHKDIDYLWAENLKIIESLNDDDYPQITHKMFSKDFQPGWDERHIHFAVNYKNLEFSHLQSWVDKFEGILSQLMWLSAKAYIETDLSGDFNISWNIDIELLKSWTTHHWTPTTKWNTDGLQKK